MGKPNVGKKKPLLCLVCTKTIGKMGFKLQCGGECKRWVHLGCTSIKKEDIEGSRRAEIQYFCKSCEEDSGGQSSSEEEDESDSFSVKSSPPRLNHRQSFLNKKKHSPSPKMKSKNITNKDMLDYLTKQFEKLEKAVTFNGNMMEDIEKTVKKIMEENKSMKKEVEASKKKIFDLEQELQLLKHKTGKMEEEERCKNVIVIGLQPKTKDEARCDVGKIFKKLDAAIPDGDVSIQVISSSNVTKPVLVTFKSVEQKEMVMQRRKDKRTLDSLECGLSGEKRSLFINDDLPRDTRMLFNKARSLKEHNYKFVWCKYGNVYVRKSDNSEVIKISNLEQVESLKLK